MVESCHTGHTRRWALPPASAVTTSCLCPPEFQHLVREYHQRPDDVSFQTALVGRGPRIVFAEIGAVDHPRRERPRNRPHRDRGVPTHAVGRAPKSPHRDRGTPVVARQRHRAPPGSRTTTVLPPRRERPRNRPHEIGGCRPRREGLEIVLTKSGVPAGVCTTPPGAGARRACAWGSIFWKAKTSPGKITTASDHVAPLDSDGLRRSRRSPHRPSGKSGQVSR
jgi:hypothetical protein